MADYAIHDTTLIGISNVIRKKEGSSALIDPADYSDRINLMGMLEVKSASGAIASFADGADGVPVKSCSVSFTPSGGGGTPQNPISVVGVSGLSVTRTGKNLVNGYTDYNVTNKMIEPVFLKAGNYTVSFQRSVGVSAIYVRKGQTVSLVGDAYAYKYNSTFFAFNADVDGYYFIQLYRSANSATWEEAPISDVQLEVGSTATTYSAYVTPVVTQDTFGQTIYGGTRDLTTDTASVWSKITLDENGSYGIATGTTTNRINAVFYNTVGKVNGSFASEKLKTGDNTAGDHKSEEWVVWGSTSASRCWISVPSSIDTVDKFKTFLQSNPIDLYYETEIPVYVTGLTAHAIDTLYGDNNIYADTGTTEVEYRSSGTETIITPTLVTKNITDNGTYNASSDNADGYSSVTVALPLGTKQITENGTYQASADNLKGFSSVTVDVGSSGFSPLFTETLIGDNSSHASSFTLSEAYDNYDMVKIVWYESASSSGFLYTTPDILDEIFAVGVGKICINKPSTNYYVCYTKSGLTWTQTNQRNIFVHEIYGVTFTNCTMQATDLYKRGASTMTRYAITSQTSLKDYDLFIMSSIHNTDGSETMPTTWLYQYPKENMSEAFSCPVPTVLQEYNANDEAFVISEFGMTSARYFMVQGIKFTPTPSLLSMSPAPVSQEESEEEEE